MTRAFLALALLAFAACAGPPPPAPARPAPAPAAQVPPPPAPPPLPVSHPDTPRPLGLPTSPFLCGDAATSASFADFELAKGERPVDVALSDKTVYVLFQPARLVMIPRGNPKSRREIIQKDGQVWKSLDLDPLDGSAWITSDRFVLQHVGADGSPTVIPLGHVKGEGGLPQLLAGRDALYATPVCAKDGVWRLGRDGRPLGSAFPVAAKPDEPQRIDTVSELRCSPVRITRGPDGEIVAHDYERRTSFTVDGQGTWKPFSTSWFDGLPPGGVIAGVSDQEEGDTFYSSGHVGRLFFWRGSPVFLGPRTTDAHGVSARLVFFPEKDRLRRLVATCGGEQILEVVTHGTAYAAITQTRVLFGEMAAAPELPGR